MGFSGPVLALHASGDGTVEYARGPSLTSNGIEHQLLSDSTTIHGIRHFGSSKLVFGGREIFVTGHSVVRTRDWVLSATLVSEYLFAVVMHNRVEIYKSCGEIFEYQSTIACPTHALLYSAEIALSANHSVVEVIGGGVMCSVFFWSFSLKDFSITSHRTVQYHKGSVFRIRMSSDLRQLLTTSDDRTVALWTRDTPSGPFEVTQTFSGHHARVWDAVWVGPALIATACEDSLVRVFSLASGAQIDQLEGHSRDVRTLASTDTTLWSGGEDGSVREWDLAASNNSTTWALPSGGKADWIRGVHLLNDNCCVVVTKLGQIFIVKDGKVLHAFSTSLKSEVTCSLVSDSVLFVGFIGGSVELIDLGTKHTVAVHTSIVAMRALSLFPLSGGAIVSNHCGDVAIIQGSGNLVTFTVNGNRASGKLTSHLILSPQEWVFGDEKGLVHFVTHALDPVGRHIESIRVSRAEKVISLEKSENRVLVNISSGQTCLIIRATGSYKIVSKSKYVSHICETGVGFNARDFIVYDEVCPQFVVNCGGYRRPFAYELSGNAYIFVYATNDTVVTVRGRPKCKTVVSGSNGDLVHALAWLDESTVLTGNEDNASRVIDAQSLRLKASLSIHEGSVRALVRIGDFVVSGGARSQLSLFRVRDGGVEFDSSVSLGTDNDVRVMGISGLVMGEDVVGLACTSNSDIYIFSVTSLTGSLEIKKCLPVDAISMSVCLSAATDGTSFYVGCGNGVIAQFGLDGKCLGTRRIHQSGVNSITAVNGLVLSVSDDQSIAVTKQLQIVSKIDNASCCSIRAITSDGHRRIFTTGTDRRLSEWQLTLSGDLIAVSSEALSVTDPLSLAVIGESIVIGGRGLQSFPLKRGESQ